MPHELRLDDPGFDRGLPGVFQRIGRGLRLLGIKLPRKPRVQEHPARIQALAANYTLSLLGALDFEALSEEKRAELIESVFRFTSYALAGMPAVVKAVAAVHDFKSQEQSAVAIVRMLGLLFERDPEPLIRRMLDGEVDQDPAMRDLSTASTEG